MYIYTFWGQTNLYPHMFSMCILFACHICVSNHVLSSVMLNLQHYCSRPRRFTHFADAEKRPCA